LTMIADGEIRPVTRRSDRGPMNDTADAMTMDLRGLKCPLPALRTRKALSRLRPGAALVVECTDPLAEIDIPNLIRETGDILEDKARRDDVLVFRIRKRST
jgi:tRNA 2-thiouridine synthesizing protein A